MSSPAPDPERAIENPELRLLYREFLDSVRGMDEAIRIEVSRLESRIYLGDVLLCRVAPYCELFHVRIEGETVWETRVRNRANFAEMLDRVLAAFLRVYASNQENQAH